VGVNERHKETEKGREDCGMWERERPESEWISEKREMRKKRLDYRERESERAGRRRGD